MCIRDRDMYLNIIIGLSYKWYDAQKLETFFHMLGGRPVSYTHLDVYKRQWWCRLQMHITKQIARKEREKTGRLWRKQQKKWKEILAFCENRQVGCHLVKWIFFVFYQMCIRDRSLRLPVQPWKTAGIGPARFYRTHSLHSISGPRGQRTWLTDFRGQNGFMQSFTRFAEWIPTFR